MYIREIALQNDLSLKDNLGLVFVAKLVEARFNYLLSKGTGRDVLFRAYGKALENTLVALREKSGVLNDTQCMIAQLCALLMATS